MVTVVGIRFKKAGKIYYFDPVDIDLSAGDYAIVETARGVEYGEVVLGPKEVLEEELVAPVKPVLRKPSKADHEKAQENLQKEKDALVICQEKIDKHSLDMKLIDVEYTFDNNKVIFYFSAEGRVDFRELVKDLASVFKTRIELRQIGVRDEAKMLGGMGPCGGSLCCSTWLGDFEPVSIKMAKEQGLSLNPNKISGICGRLLCCLKFEQNAYEDAKDRMPIQGDKVKTAEGIGEVIDVDLVQEKVKVKFKGEDMVIQQFPAEEVEVLQSKRKKGGCCSSKNGNGCNCNMQSQHSKKSKSGKK